MNDRTLKDFYYGNLKPGDRQMVHGSEIAHVAAELSQAEEALEQALAPELQPLLERLVNAQMALDSLAAEAHYIDGFKTGARFMMEILDDTYRELEPISE